LEKSGIEPVLVFNKSDLATEEEMMIIKNQFKGTGYQIHFITAKDSKGLEALFKGLAHEITVLCGPSGAGKSTLLNKLSGSEKMETGVISEKVKRGKHTTRHSELITLDDALLVDTPGFSTMEMTMEAKELKQYFPEFHVYEGECRFQGCNHDKEPGCKVKNEVGKTISTERYNYYLKYYNELLEENKRKW